MVTPPRRHRTATGLPVHVHIDGEFVVLRLHGEIDVANSAALVDAVHAATGEGDTGVVLDLTEVTFVDSSGLRAIVRSLEALGRSGIGLTVRNAAPHVRRLFELSGLDSLLA
jgi:anti-anti-sigma factor